MTGRQLAIVLVAMVLGTCAAGQESAAAKPTRVVLRPDLVESAFCGVRVPIEGTYYVSVNQIIELDVSESTVPNCGPDRLAPVSDDITIVKWYMKEPHVWIDSGNGAQAYLGEFFKAVKKGEATITITLSNVGSPPAVATFKYHIVVR